MPLEFLKNNLKANIHKLSIISKKDNVAFYEAITDFGYMTLIVESIIEPSKE